ncbi:MAG: ABC transporter substrate-binding protein [Betaproteobacteria bacterium]|nr:ABC transporter substrate-binding protein [Betaproteobacteria bacterium]
MNNRRKFIVALGAGALTAPFGAYAQQQGKVWRIGFLGSTSALGYAPQLDALRGGLRELGYVEGKNIVIEYRWAEGNFERLPGLAAELARLGVDVIVTHGTPGTRTAKQATTTIPIVMAAIGDAVAAGIVTSLARPGGNITGTTFFVPELAAKRLEIIRDAMPRARRVAVLLNPGNPVAESVRKAMEPTAKALKLELQQFPVRAPEEFDGAFSAMAAKRMDAFTTYEDPINISNVKTLADLAAKRRLPSVSFPDFADAGGMLGYGASIRDMFRRAAYFVDRIFKGAKAGDLPVEQWSKFELIVNLKTAKMLGIKLPNLVLQRADRVIE